MWRGDSRGQQDPAVAQAGAGGRRAERAPGRGDPGGSGGESDLPRRFSAGKMAASFREAAEGGAVPAVSRRCLTEAWLPVEKERKARRGKRRRRAEGGGWRFAALP